MLLSTPWSDLGDQTLISVLSITISPGSVSYAKATPQRQPENASAVRLLHFPLEKLSLKQTSYPKGSPLSPTRLGLITSSTTLLTYFWKRNTEPERMIERCLSDACKALLYSAEVEQVDAPNWVIPLWKLQRTKVNTMAAYVSHYSQSSNIPFRRLDRTCLGNSHLYACE